MKDKYDPGTIDLETWLSKDRLKEEFDRSRRGLENGDDKYVEDAKLSPEE